MSRILAREKVFQLIFEYIFLREPNYYTLELMTIDDNLTDDDRDYINTTYVNVIDNFQELEGYISKYITSYSIDRLLKTDLAALILSSYEILKADIPVKVSVNEACNLVKKFSSEKSPFFVNGVLGSITDNDIHNSEIKNDLHNEEPVEDKIND